MSFTHYGLYFAEIRLGKHKYIWMWVRNLVKNNLLELNATKRMYVYIGCKPSQKFV